MSRPAETDPGARAWRDVAARLAVLSSERGTGLIGSIIGLLLFFGFLLLAIQVAVSLYATTMATSAAFDAAQRYSVSSGDHGLVDSSPEWATAESHARDQLGSWGQQVVFEPSIVGPAGDEQRIAVQVRGEVPALLPSFVGTLTNTRAVDRTVEVRLEEFRP